MAPGCGYAAVPKGDMGKGAGAAAVDRPGARCFQQRPAKAASETRYTLTLYTIRRHASIDNRFP